MPFVIHPRVRKGLGRLAAMTATGVLASTGVAAAASCPTLSTTTPLSQFGDTNNYFVVPGGTFEGSSALPAGWTASGASVTAGNEPAHVMGSADSQSLSIPAGGSATSQYMCIDATMPEMRFFAHQAAAGSDLKVDVLVKTWNGTLDVPLAYLADGSMNTWGPTAPIFAPPGQSIAIGTTVQGALKFSVAGSAGSWQIDDVLVDPYRSA